MPRPLSKATLAKIMKNIDNALVIIDDKIEKSLIEMYDIVESVARNEEENSNVRMAAAKYIISRGEERLKNYRIEELQQIKAEHEARKAAEELQEAAKDEKSAKTPDYTQPILPENFGTTSH